MARDEVEMYRVPVVHVSVYRAGSFCGTEVFSQSRILIGRHPGADINLVCETVSRMHAVISVRDDGMLVEDMGSRNGTLVNGQPVKRCYFGFLDSLQLGTFELRFRLMPYMQAQSTWRDGTTLVEIPDEEQTIEVTALPGLLSIRAGGRDNLSTTARNKTVAEGYDLSLSFQPDEEAVFPLADVLEPEDEHSLETTVVRGPNDDRKTCIGPPLREITAA